MKELITALVKARKGFKEIVKDKTNPHYKSRYATLDSVLAAVNPAMIENGLTLIQTTAIDGDKFILRTHLFHSSGETIASDYLLPAIGDPQKMGAALTYARRYAVCAILSVTADEDDDGNGTKSRPGDMGDGRATLMAATAAEMTRAGWSGKDGASHVMEVYGKKKRDELSNQQLQEFLGYLKSQPTAEEGAA